MSKARKHCTICKHKDVAQINQKICNGASIMGISKIWGFARSTIKKHKDICMMEELSEKTDIVEVLSSDARLRSYEERFDKTNKMVDAVDRWMRDPDNPDQYSIDDRANEIDVVYQEWDKETGRLKVGKQKSTLQDLLIAVDAGGFMVRELTSRRIDPRKLLLEALKEEREMIKMVMDLTQKAREWEYKNRITEKENKDNKTESFEKQIDTITERVILARRESNTEELSKMAELPEIT